MEQNIEISFDVDDLYDEQYFAHPNISSSDLTIFKEGGLTNFIYKKYYKKTNLDTESLTLGSLVHCLILEPQKFNDRYYIISGQKPISFNQEKFASLVAGGMDVVEAYANSYSVRGKSEAKIKEEADKLAMDLLAYIQSLSQAQGKIVISQELSSLAISMYNEGYLRHPWIQQNVINACGCRGDVVHVERAVFWDCPVTLVPLKAKIDKLIINDRSRTVTVLDFKTTKNAGFGFLESIEKYNYVQQAAFYTKALKESNLLNEDEKTYSMGYYLIPIQSSEPIHANVVQIHNDSIQHEILKINNTLAQLQSKGNIRIFINEILNNPEDKPEFSTLPLIGSDNDVKVYNYGEYI